MRGQMTSEDIISHVSHSCQVSKEELAQSLALDSSRMHVDPQLLYVIKKFRNLCPTYLVTGNMDCFKVHTVRALKLYEIFTDIIVSSDIGLMKTDDMFPEWFEKRYGVFVSDCWLLDDDINSGLTFCRFGGNYIRVSNPSDTLNCLRALYQSMYSTF